MILATIELVNFRSYHGTHKIDLSKYPSQGRRNIIAIGGLNGAGKTTLLDGITFTLLGVPGAYKFLEGVDRRGDGREQIDRTLVGLLNRRARDEGERETRVTLIFCDSNDRRFSVQRTWFYDYQARFKEDALLVTTSGDESLASDQYEDFLKNRIPPELVQFFMFDGEKIQAIAQDEVGDSVVKGIDSLLGFHILDSLVSDMDGLQDKYRKEAQRRNRQEEELSELRTEETKLANQIQELDDEKIELEERIDRLKDKNRQLVEQLNDALGGQGTNPKDIQKQLDEVNDNIRDLKEQILNSIDRSIIPGMPANLLRELSVQLDGEEHRAQWEEGKRKVEPQRNRLVEHVLGDAAPQPTPPLEFVQLDFLRQRIRQEWDDLFNPPPQEIAKVVIHNYLSAEERNQVRAKCSQAIRPTGVDLSGLFNKLDSADRKGRDLRQLMERLGDGERVTAIVEEKTQVDRQLGEAQTAWDSTDRRITAIGTDLKDIRQKVRKKEDELLESEQSSERANFVRKVKRVVQQYQEVMRPRKRDEVADNLTDMYRLLARKEDVVDRIELDEKTYRPRLLDRRGNVMPLHSLSAGEREIYALSLLWALSKTSRRELPVVIDTPLARLDSQHRSSIVKKYLPHAGPQVIVLSTDTELDREYFELIKDRLAGTLRLEFDRSTEQTTVHDGYFTFS